MRNGICNNLPAVVLSVCVLTAVASAQGESSQAWDPAEHLTPFWDSVELESQIENPARNPEADPNGQRQLVIRAGVEMTEYENLIGIDRRERGILVQGRDGSEMYRADNESISRSYWATENVLQRIGIDEWADEFSFSLTIPLRPNQGLTRVLGRIEWAVDLLIAETFTTVDIPFEPNETWVEVVPGLEIRVDEATVTEGRYSYHLQAIYDPNLVSYGSSRHWHFWSDERVPTTLLLEMDVLNAAGESVRDLSSSGAFGSGTSSHSTDDGLIEATSTGHGSCSACGDATTIRYTFGLDAYELRTSFALEDIPISGF